MSDVTIRLVGEAEEDGVYTLGLAESAHGADGFVLLLMIAEPDEDGDGCCVVVEPGQRTAYEAIAGCTLGPNELRLRFARAAANDLDLPEDFVLAFDDERRETVDRGLRRLGIEPIDPG